MTDEPAEPNQAQTPDELRRLKRASHIFAGKQAITEMVSRYGAVIWGEIIARAADRAWFDNGRRVNPHILATALHQLTASGEVLHVSEKTRGGRIVTVFVPAKLEGRKRDIERSAARKRLISTRYLGWAAGSAEGSSGVIGAAAEDAVHFSLREAAPQVGYKLLNPSGGSTTSVFGVSLAEGSLDNAALYSLSSPKDLPTQYLLAIEVKSLREWIYPHSVGLFQLLSKGAVLANALRPVRVLPVLICRKAHITTYRMARDLGFHVIDTLGTQWLPQLTSISESAVIEVRQELGYVDLRFLSGADKYLVKQFSEVIPEISQARADRWDRVGSQFGDLYADIRRTPLGIYPIRLKELRASCKAALDELPHYLRGEHRAGGW